MYTMNAMLIGSTLRTLRGEKSQSEVSAALGVTKSSWSMYERGERIPRDEIKVEIANYFGKTVQEIFYA
jgi:putative transcriptional regulator